MSNAQVLYLQKNIAKKNWQGVSLRKLVAHHNLLTRLPLLAADAGQRSWDGLENAMEEARAFEDKATCFNVDKFMALTLEDSSIGTVNHYEKTIEKRKEELFRIGC